MISELYKNYFQKSRAFIYPLTNMPKNSVFNPVCTYITWKGKFEAHDVRLMAKYEIGEENKKWEEFLAEILLKNPFFESCYYAKNENSAIVVFNMKSRGDSFMHVVSGRYSKITPEMRSLILMYYGYNTSEWAYIETFLTPAKFMGLYAKLLGCDVSDLESQGELCDIPDMKLEHLAIDILGKE
jgi:hypothetical protein